MQRFVSKLVTQNHHHHHHSHRVFTSLSKSSQLKPQLRNHINIPTSLRHRFHSCRSIFTTIHGASNSPNALLRTLLHFPRPFLLHCRSFRFNQTPDRHFRNLRLWIHRLTPREATWCLIKANVAVFFLWGNVGEKFMTNNFTISVANIKSGRLHTLITNAFSHIWIGHIFSNMLGLYVFGMNVRLHALVFGHYFSILSSLITFSLAFGLIGVKYGPEFLLKLYFAGAVGGSVFYLIHQAYKAQSSKDSRSSKELALGASGALYAIMLLDIFFPQKSVLYSGISLPFPAATLLGNSRVSGSVLLGGAVVAPIAWARARKGRF